MGDLLDCASVQLLPHRSNVSCDLVLWSLNALRTEADSRNLAAGVQQDQYG
jgi:hypothetical protein